MLKHIVNNHPGEEISKIKFGMRIVGHARTSFERQIREAVLIQQEKSKHEILNSKSEYNRSALPRITAQMGEQETREKERILRQEKAQEEEIESKIRTLRKQRNKERMVPTKEPASKRRKLDNNAYQNIKQAWGEPTRSEQQKTSRQDMEQAQVPVQDKLLPPPSKKQRQETLTNLRVIENKVVEGPLEDLELEDKIDWEEKLRNHKEKIEKETEERERRLKRKEDKEKSWELYRLCKNYLEENSEDWGKRKMKRIEDKNRQERLQLAKCKQKKGQINFIKEKIEIGMERIPLEERKKMEENEKKEERLEIQKTKQDLWKLRRKEKKITGNALTNTLTEIQKLTSKLEKITYILKEERRKDAIEEERKKKQRELEENLRRVMEEKRKKRLQKEREKKERLEKIEKVKERWALMRWITEFIEENSENWEKERNIRLEKERKELLEWERSNRFEKIRKLKENWSKERQETQQKTNNIHNTKNKKFVPSKQTRSNTWSQWREYKGKSRLNYSKIPLPLANKPPSIKPAAKLRVKILPSKLLTNKNKHRIQQEAATNKTVEKCKLEEQKTIKNPKISPPPPKYPKNPKFFSSPGTKAR